MTDQGWSDYLRAAMSQRRFDTASQISRASGIGESLISRWLRGETQPDLANLRKLSGPLGVPLLKLLVAAGHITAEEARLQDVKPPERTMVSVTDAVEDDDVLIEEAKQHLLNQYELLRRLSEPSDSKSTARPTTPAAERPLRAVARKKPPRRDEK